MQAGPESKQRPGAPGGGPPMGARVGGALIQWTRAAAGCPPAIRTPKNDQRLPLGTFKKLRKWIGSDATKLTCRHQVRHDLRNISAILEEELAAAAAAAVQAMLWRCLILTQ